MSPEERRTLVLSNDMAIVPKKGDRDRAQLRLEGQRVYFIGIQESLNHQIDELKDQVA